MLPELEVSNVCRALSTCPAVGLPRQCPIPQGSGQGSVSGWGSSARQVPLREQGAQRCVGLVVQENLVCGRRLKLDSAQKEEAHVQFWARGKA